ncbi:MAG: hypothetical protein LRY37_02190, partial [Alkalibacterium thalassium]|nr:hypothetical protein [Alkalibacterium thalassium]
SVSEIKRMFEEPDDGQMVKIDVTNPRQSNRYVEDELERPKFLQEVLKPSGAEIGKATHLVLQAIDLNESLSADDIKAEVNKLASEKVITEDIAELIPVEKNRPIFPDNIRSIYIR